MPNIFLQTIRKKDQTTQRRRINSFPCGGSAVNPSSNYWVVLPNAHKKSTKADMHATFTFAIDTVNKKKSY
jgi:hypothetical protein